MNRRSQRFEMAAGILAAIVSAVVVGWLGRASWFFGDVWGFITRRGSLAEALILPHNGHLVWPAAMTYKVLYGLFGMDYWPWYFLPRLLGFGLVAFVLWRMMLRQGADRRIAFLGYLTILVLGTSPFLTAAVVGNFVAVIVLVLVADHLDRSSGANPRNLFLVFGAVILMLSATSLGVAGFVGVGVAVAAFRHLRGYWIALIAGVVPYGVWYATYGGGSRGSPDLTYESFLALPALTFEMVSIAVARFAGLDRTFGPVLLVALVVGIMILVRQSRIRTFTVILGGAALAYIAMVLLVRVVTNQIPIGSDRYGYVLTLLLVPALLPYIRIRGHSRFQWTVLIVVGSLILTGNLRDLDSGLDFWETKAASVKEIVSGTANLIQRGEPYLPQARLDVQHATSLTLSDVALFVEDGWDPRMPSGVSDDVPIEVAARAELRMDLRQVSEADVTGSSASCTRLRNGDAVRIDLLADDRALVLSGQEANVTLEWQDEFGRGITSKAVSGDRLLALSNPAEGATLRIHNERGSAVEVCRRSGLPPGSEAD